MSEQGTELIEYSLVIKNKIERQKQEEIDKYTKESLYTSVIFSWNKLYLLQLNIKYNWIIQEELFFINNEIHKLKNTPYKNISVYYLKKLLKWLNDTEKIMFI